MRRRLLLLAAMLSALAFSCTPETEQEPTKAAEAPAPQKFSAAVGGWTFREKNPLCSFSTDQKVTGEHSIKVVDPSKKDGSDTASAKIKIDPKYRYKISWQVYPVSGSGLGVYTQFFDGKGEKVGSAHAGNPGVPLNKWIRRETVVEPPENAASLGIWIHSYQAAIVAAYLDDFKIEQLPPPPPKPPWKGTYKIKPGEKEKLTEADVVGPDGIVYPDWTYAGVPGGIPKVEVKLRAEDFGAKPDDEGDDSAAIQKAVDALAEKGGGALLIAPGTFYLDRTILVESDNVVIRGSGMDRTKLIFRYKDGPTAEKRVRFFWPEPNSTVDRNTWIEIHCYPKDLMRMTIAVDGKVICDKRRSLHWGGTFSIGAWGRAVTSKVKSGKHILRGVAEYRNGEKFETKIEVTVDTKSARPQRKPNGSAAILFRGKGYDGKKLKLAEDGKRGSREILLAADPDLKAGDRIFMRAPATERWKELTGNKCKWGWYRCYQFVIERVNGRRLRLNQPLRIEYPIIDGAYVQKWKPIRRCGAEDFYIEHWVPFWMTGVSFQNAWESWARNLHVKKAGRHAVYFGKSKWCEIRDCVMDDSWNHGGGGSAYVGWQTDWDCLMENCKVSRMRHGPCYQWAASGNVIRNSTFYQSDGQWHAGWTNENLIENCVIDAKKGTGSYGYGFWASPPEDEAHGPEGPRNVVYNCDVKSPRGSLWMGGMNENWIIAYNRFFAETGPSVFARCASFDHIIRGNVFILKDPKQPAIILKDKNCIGVEIYDNVILGGNGKLLEGRAKPAVNRTNTIRPFGDAPRPKPPVPSIFEWQRKNRRRR
ncbi:MAG: hypothetical protein GXP25_24570 [Planctomycetes bacterium]|nr:hypothetical protein [Planctomycetota bacterium]